MAKAWSEVAASPEFQALQPDQQEAARSQYFQSVVAPQVPADALDQVRTQFDAQTAIKPAASKAYTSSILPFSKDAQGSVHFDTNAGILGSLKRAVMLPGDVAAGKVDPLSDEGIGRSFELAGVASPVTPAVNSWGALPSILGGVASQSAPKVAAPTSDALRAAAKQGYDQAKNMGVDFSAGAVGDLAKSLRSSLEQDGILAELAPKSFSILSKLENPPEGAVASLGSLDAARKAFGKAGKDFQNPTDQEAARRLVDGLRGFMESPPEGAVVAGPAEQASKIIRDANGNWGAAKRSEQIMGRDGQDYTAVANRADLQAGAAHSGTNWDNSIRQQVKSLLLNQKKTAGYSPEELDALKKVAVGTPASNTLRYVGNLLGGGGGLGAVAAGGMSGAAGAALGGPLGFLAGAVPPAVGILAKKGATSLTNKSLSQADEMIRQRSPLYGLLAQGAQSDLPAIASPVGQAAAGGTAIPTGLLRALMLMHQQPQLGQSL